MTTAPDPDITAADLGRFEPALYDLGFTADPEGTWQDGRSAGSGMPAAGLTAPGGDPVFPSAGGRLVYDAEPESADGGLAGYPGPEQPVPYSPTPAAEAALAGSREIEEAFAAAEEFFGCKPGAAARLLADYEVDGPEAAYELAAEVLDEWDSCDSAAYQDRLEAQGDGPEPEAEP